MEKDRSLVPRVRRAVVALALLAAPLSVARAQLGYDPFAGNGGSRAEEKWSGYSTPSTGGTNRPTSTAVNGTDNGLATANSFNIGVTSPDAATNDAFIIGGPPGRIYSPGAALTLTLTSTLAPVGGGAFDTVIFSIRTAGNPLNAPGVVLTPSGGQAISARYSSLSTSGSGMGAVSQYAFQYDLTSIGGSNNFTITLPGSASSVSFGASQLDATTTSLGATNVVPEPAANAAVAAGLAALSLVALRRRARS